MNELSPEQRARSFASHVRGDDKSYDGMRRENQIYYAWTSGYHDGMNDVLEKWNAYRACQPPQPIKVDKSEISLQTYKMFVREKIKRDSKGSWWARVKLWYKFLIA